MGAKHIYKATHIETGEVIEGTASELAERLEIKLKNFYCYIDRETKAKGVWAIERLDNQQEKQCTSKTLFKTLVEWDELTGPVREYIKRRDERN